MPPHQSDRDIITSLGTPETSKIYARYGYPLTTGVHKYLVKPTSFPSFLRSPGSSQLKVIGFGGAFLHGEKSRTLGCLITRAPEDLLASQKDMRSDLWGLGCTMFELIVGSSLFTHIPPERNELICQWIGMFGNPPEDWKVKLPTNVLEYDDDPLERWFQESYFQEPRVPDLSQSDITSAGALLQLIMKYRPSDRPSVASLLDHPWLLRGPSLCTGAIRREAFWFG
ncbi:MAG: hypothetical protein M1812_003466 [Candelaria pacifica]|nr:MAG: hypothetical protein M1812_003466 [Candelaria pacifica]